MELPVFNTSGQETDKKVELSDGVFQIEPVDHVLYLAVKQHLANKRQGTHYTKTRKEIVGSTRKIKRQKGTGTARAGSIKNPLFRGGGTVFGPKPRDYSMKLNKKVKSLAKRSALSYKAKDESIFVVEDVNFDAPKTKLYIELLKAFSLQDKKVLMVLPSEGNKNVYLSLRNLPKVDGIQANLIHTYQVMHADVLLVCESAVEKLNAL